MDFRPKVQFGTPMKNSSRIIMAFLWLQILCPYASAGPGFEHGDAVIKGVTPDEKIGGRLGYTRLHQATLKGDFKRIRELLRNGADPNETSTSGDSALSFAIRSNSGSDRVALAKILIAAGAHPNYPDHNGHMPLHWAVLRQDIRSITFLLEHGADVHSRSYQGTPLHIALECLSIDQTVDEHGNLVAESPEAHWERHKRVAKLLLAAGANLDALRYYMGPQRPIDSFYMRTRREDMLELRQAFRPVEPQLSLYPGEDINAPRNRNWSRLHYAAMDGHIDIIRALLKLGAEVDISKEGRGRTPLARAANASVAKLLLDAGADPNHVGSSRLTPLIRHSSKGNEEIVRLLLEHGARINVADTQNMSPIHYAASGKHPGVLRILLDNGARFEGRRTNGETPLIMASAAYDSRCAELLLSYGADVNSADHKGYTPLHKAVLNEGYYSTMKVILSYGPDPSATNEDGKTPRDIAQERGYTKQLEALLAYEKRREEEREELP